MSESFSTVDLPSPGLCATLPLPTSLPTALIPIAFLCTCRPHRCSPIPTVPIGLYTRVSPAMAVYVMAGGSSFCSHLAWTPTRALAAPPLLSASEGTPQAARIARWSFELDTLPLSECPCQAVDMLFYMGNCCIHDLLSHPVAEMPGCWDVTIICDLGIPLVAWFAALYGQRYPEFVDINPATLLHERLVERLDRSIRGNQVKVGQREHGGTAAQVRKPRAARKRYQHERAARLEERRVELVNRVLGGMKDALDGLLDPEDHLCFQQVHNGQVEACMAALEGLDLDWNDF